jgi:hypothetical protein
LKSTGAVAPAFTPDAKLKRAIREHFAKLGFTKGQDGTLQLPGHTKQVVRQLHGGQRHEKLAASSRFVEQVAPKLLPHFAGGGEIDTTKITLALIRVRSGTWQSDLFRFASLTWSVPVSAGFGRRMRYLVWDTAHDRLAGLIALGDPVFNLGVRDTLIGWSAKDRAARLVNILDAYVLGAVPPYNFLLGGKAVACLIRSKEVIEDFRESYGKSVGIISGEAKHAPLLAVTTTSSMGKSSVYNRLKLDGTRYFTPIGFTLGWGHFHITDDIFAQMRDFLRLRDHKYADHHEYGEGPNWRLRTIKAALNELEIGESALRHGVKREVFIATLAGNALSMLKSGTGNPDRSGIAGVAEISQMAVERWMLPRSIRNDRYRHWERSSILDLIAGVTAASGSPEATTAESGL